MKLEESRRRIQEEFDEIDNTIGWNSVYLNIKKESRNEDLSCHEARLAVNKPLNRYRDVSPYDHSRVILKGTPSYINASLVKVERAGRKYILTQGPLPNTSGHFWRMCFEQKSKAILMLNRVIEKNTIKCSQYWPVGGEESDTMDFDDVGLRIHLLSQTQYHNFIRRSLCIEELSTGEKLEIYQFHYITWPDFGVPSSPRAFLHFLQSVRDSGSLNCDGPPIVHCSAGIGRSGTFCLVDTILHLMEQGCEVNVKELLLEMRKFRMGLIQTADQLRFSYLAILEGAQLLSSGVTSFPEEENGHEARIDDEKPPVPVRNTSLPIENELQKMIDKNISELDVRPLPPVPNSDSFDTESEDEEDSDDDGSDSDKIEDDEDESRSNNTHVKTNGIDEEALRRRLKKEQTLSKLREIKQKQKEAEQRERMTGLVTDKRVMFCLGVSAILLYYYFKV